MRQLAYLMVIAAAALAIVAFSSGHVAVADEQIRTLQYIETSGHLKSGPDYALQVMILDGCLKRTTVRRKPEDGFPVGELPEPSPNDPFQIDDAKNGKCVYVVPEKRQFKRTTSYLVYMKDELGKVQRYVRPVEPDPDQDFERDLRQPVPIEKAHKQLPERIVDGRHAIGYEIRQYYLDEGMSTTIYWVDTTAQRPVRIEHYFKAVDPKDDIFVRMQRNIVFDAPLDKALFSTDPPPGYKVLPDSDQLVRRLFGAGP
jgi:hypothetical protein